MFNRRRRGKHLAKNICLHRHTTTAPNAGLEFTICKSCGQVSIKYISAILEDDIVIPDEDETVRSRAH